MRGLTLAGAATRLSLLAEETGETVNSPSGTATGRSTSSRSTRSLRRRHRLDEAAAPLHASANGKVLPRSARARWQAPRLTPQTIVDRAQLRAELERTRRAGFAVAVEELELGLHAVAAPVFDATGSCVAAVSVSGPAYRLTEPRLPELGRLCAAAAADVSARLGFRRAA